jgi:glycosyltransferase involved in cell wall biosynthesis
MSTNNVLLSLASLGRSKVICIGTEHIHPPQVSLGCVWSVLRRLSYRRLWAVVALTARSARWLEQHTHATRVRVIPNPVPWPLPLAAGVSAPPAKREGRLVCAGRLDRQKGFDLMLPCFARLAPIFDGWDLVIIGEGPERASLERSINELGLQGRVHLPGFVGNISEWYATADIFVMPSRFEGFPMALLEAMASGVPAVSFDCNTGPREIIRDGVDGVLVSNGDIAQLEAEIAALMQDSEQRTALATRALEVQTRFSIGSIGHLWMDLLDEALRPSHRST